MDKKLDDMFELVNNAGKGAIVFINQQNKPLSTLNRLKTLKKSQSKGKIVKAPRIEMDNRDFGIGAQILRAMNIGKIKLLSNNPKKRVGLSGYGIEIVNSVAIEIESNEHNRFYLQTKRDKMGHSLKHLDA